MAMRRMELPEIRQIQLELLAHFSEFCEKNKLTWFLSNGTLLGAVKYQGYIPWDDDIDVCMPRADYDKLLELYKESAPYRLLSFDGAYLFPFAKLANMETRLVEANTGKSEMGINIDVFPLDHFGNSKEEAQALFQKAKLLRHKLAWAKLRRYRSNTPIKAAAKWLIASMYRLIGAEHYCKKLMELSVDPANGSNLVGNLVWGFYGVGEAHEAAVFADSIQVSFEGCTYPAPVGYDSYLRGLYGDYEPDPPKEKQVSHHVYEAYYL